MDTCGRLHAIFAHRVSCPKRYLVEKAEKQMKKNNDYQAQQGGVRGGVVKVQLFRVTHFPELLTTRSEVSQYKQSARFTGTIPNTWHSGDLGF